MPIKPSFFQGQNIQTQGIFKQRKDMTIREEISYEKREKFKRWITFYRRNPVRFIEDYFQIKLFPYQKLAIWLLQKCDLAYIVASRASAKTWIVAVWSLTLCTLYPGMKIKICAKTMKQASELLSDKLQSIRDTHPMVNRELDTIVCNANGNYATFFNGSIIRVVPAKDSARGGRANLVIIEESRFVPREIVESVIIPFLETRNPPYRQISEYENNPLYEEEGRISYISSAGYKVEWWFEKVKNTIKRMLDGDAAAGFMAFDYSVCLRHGIKTKAMLRNEMENSDEITIQLEYLNIPSGMSGKSFYRISFFPRKMKRAYYPQYLETFVPANDYQHLAKKNPYNTPKTDGEIRLLSIDIAARANKKNDITSISVARLIPMMGKGYNRQLIYLESFKGENQVSQAKRVKQVFYDLDCDFLAMDIKGLGIGVYDPLTQVTPDEERGVEYPPFTIVEDYELDISQESKDDLIKRTLGADPKHVIFPIVATMELNSDIAIAFRGSLQKKMWDFLTGDAEAEEFLLINHKELLYDDSDLKAFLLNPHVQTNLLIGECLNLNMEHKGAHIRLTETPGSHKDRFTSVSNLNWIVDKYFDPTIKMDRDVSEEEEWMTLMKATSFL
jgi:hypothetical protein